MFKKFLDGLAFGAGFAISFLTIWLVASFVTPMVFSSRITQMDGRLSEAKSRALPVEDLGKSVDSGVDFNEMSSDDQIKNASVIALAKYEPGPDGRVKAIITEFLKKDPGVEIHYKPGDEYHSASYYPRDTSDRGDGVVIFFTGSPASMRMSMSYRGDRISGLGDLPMNLFRQKCNAPGA